MKLKNRCAILVLSCDKYSSLWKPFFLQFRKYWKDNPYKVYLGSNTLNCTCDRRVKTILSGNRGDWSSNLLSIINQIPEEYVFIWLEDLFLTKKVNSALFHKSFHFMENENANHIHFAPTIRPDGISKNALFGYYSKKAPYRVSAVGFWNRDHLKQILFSGETPWQFEIFGSYRSSFFEGYYCIRKELFNFIQIVERGKIFREAFEYCEKHNIELDMTGWQIHTQFHRLISDINRFVFHGIIFVPWRIRLFLIDILRKMLATY